jgi:hypothetical protein
VHLGHPSGHASQTCFEKATAGLAVGFASIWAFVLKNGDAISPFASLIHYALAAHAKQTGVTVQVPVLSSFELDAIPVTAP